LADARLVMWIDLLLGGSLQQVSDEDSSFSKAVLSIRSVGYRKSLSHTARLWMWSNV